MSKRMVNIDAELSLNDTVRRCEVEQDFGFQLDSLKFGTVQSGGQVFEVNVADFHSESVLKILNVLEFVPVGSDDPAEIKKKRKADGWTLIGGDPQTGVSQIFVQKSVTKVMLFGKLV